MSARRVAFVYDHLYPFSVGGAERYYWALSRALAADQPVTQIAPKLWPQGPATREQGGVEQVGLAGPVEGRNPAQAAFAAAVLWHFLRHGGRYEVVHCACFPAVVALATRAGLLPHRGTKLILDWHEVLPRSDWLARRRRAGNIGWLMQKAAVRTGDAAITFSRTHERRLRELGRTENVEVMPEFTPEGEAPVAEPAPAGREALVMFAGRLVAEKRAELVPGVVAELRAADPGRDWRGLIFGAGDCEESVRAAIRAAGVEQAVELAGFAAWEEVSRAMRRASALVFPTRREGFGLVVLEAAAHGLPAVLVEHPDNASTELIEAGAVGRVCAEPSPGEMARAVLSLAADDSVHARTRGWYELARERYSAPTAVTKLRALHERLLRSG